MKQKKILPIALTVLAIVILAAGIALAIFLTGDGGGAPAATEPTEPPPAEKPDRAVIYAGESLDMVHGTALELSSADPPAGSGWVRTGADAAPVLAITPGSPVSVRGYEVSGYLHLWLYVEDASQVTGGQIELTSSGAPDDRETSWDITPGMLENGWNELELAFRKANHLGEIDYSAVNYVRVYVSFASSGYFGLDEVYAHSEKKEGKNMEQLMAEARERSVLLEGSAEMRSAIASVLRRAQRGEKVTMAALGASNMAGAGAPEGEGYIPLIARYLEGLDGDENNGNVTLVNAGVGSTEGVYAASRLTRDVLVHKPDMVIVDFGVNDYVEPYGLEAYEGILTKLISAGIPVLNVNACPRNGNNLQDGQVPINQAYGVPQVSFRTAYYELSKTTDVVMLQARNIWCLDNVHPTAHGHRLFADLVTSFFQKHILDAGVEPGEMYTTLPEKVTDNGFADAILVENTTQDERVEVLPGEGWTADYSARIFQLSTEGWQTSTVGSSITFKVNSGYFYMFFALTPQSGDLEVVVDGEVKETINWAWKGTGYMNPYHIVHLGQPAEHTVTLTFRDEPNAEQDWFGICAVGASNFAGYEAAKE